MDINNMENKVKKFKKIYILIFIIAFVIGFFVGGFTMKLIGTDFYGNKLNMPLEVISFNETMTEQEIKTLEQKVIKDEQDYGNAYQKLEGYEYVYKREPDRIYFKSAKLNGFYKFEKTEEKYEHLIEVVEDRMHYSVIDDYNLYCFTPDSVKTMLASEKNYVIFDYDNGDLDEYDENFQKDIIFSFSENTRLYRLLTSLSYYKEILAKEQLPKTEFANDTKISGYKYMTYFVGD